MLGSVPDKAAVWGERLRRYEQSALTIVEFCQRERVSVPSFYQWRKRLAKSSTGPQRFAGRQVPAASPAFQQVMLTGGGLVTIEFLSGVRMEVPSLDVPLVRAVLADLLQAEAVRRQGGV